MPFTISHIAAIWPFSRWLAQWRLLSATVIGSMVPDFGLFMPWRPARADTHSMLSLLTFCLPVGIAVYWVFQRLIKEAVFELLPDSAYVRWRHNAARADIRSPAQWLIAACGILAGALTHLVWDGFTHEGARGVRMIPVLDDPTLDIAGHHLVGVRLLQDVSSLVGLFVVLIVVAVAMRPGRAGLPPLVRRLPLVERRLWVLAYLIAAAVLSAIFLLLRRPLGQISHSPALFIGNCAIAALRGWAFALVGVSLCLRFRLPADPDGSAATNRSG